MKKFGLLLLIMMSSLLSVNVFAEEGETVDTYAYYGFEPDIVTNYISNRKKLGFVRISVELMVKVPEDLMVLEHHDPLLRAAIIEILGAQTEDKVKSLTGKEEIRRECYDTLNRLLEQEIGKPLVVNLLFTKYLYD
ncbi:flagellar basal body-associated protein FliL [Shewanella colwelliana]|uniref:Flagellar protein FliL n=1 Tax=Shewanella colwelliana TaxID=23 RepID=A0A1E5IUS4_SHECO|nr:flagellar basal body-associated protein FliL [Shewanella colwelliana]MDX1282816.1 flagellar basal body-associated protein FliL [Shewanella colwelliana]OEG74312.1 flagellar basal body-associated protein FliL [Shewanella colwelliana]GIU44691.1 flagellar basal body-associated protein FliL [Shewanella colwelliana]